MGTHSSPRRPQLLQTVLDCTDVRELAEFYRRLLGLVYRPGDEVPARGPDDAEEPLRVYTDPAGHTFCIFVG